MFSVLVHYSIEAAPLAVIAYAVVWRIMAKRHGRRLQLSRSWQLIGAAATALAAGTSRLAIALILGVQMMQELWTNQGVGLIGPLLIPALFAVCIVALLRAKARTGSEPGQDVIVSDGAVPDNRKAAFFDLFKLERYADSAQYAEGVFLWLTNEPSYRQQATGDSADFSTHQGRVYRAGTALRAARSRSQMPLPLALKRSYTFDWEPIDPLGHWYSLAIRVGGTRPDPTTR